MNRLGTPSSTPDWGFSSLFGGPANEAERQAEARAQAPARKPGRRKKRRKKKSAKPQTVDRFERAASGRTQRQQPTRTAQPVRTSTARPVRTPTVQPVDASTARAVRRPTAQPGRASTARPILEQATTAKVAPAKPVAQPASSVPTRHKFTPQVPITQPRGATLDAPIAVATTTTTKTLPTPKAMLDPKLAINRLNVDVKGQLPVTGGSYGPLSTENGALAFNASLRGGQLDAQARFTDGRGNNQPATAALIVPVHGVDYNRQNGRIEANTGLGQFDITDRVLKGRDHVDVGTLLETVGADKPFALGSSPKLKSLPVGDDPAQKMVDSSRAVATADISITPSDKPVSFGAGTEIAFAPGTRARVERTPGRTTISFDANLSQSRFGQQGGAVLTTGAGRARVVATQTLDTRGKPQWQVQLENSRDAYRLNDVKLTVPVAGKAKPDAISIGSITRGATSSNSPLLTMSNGGLRVNLDAKMTDIRGTMSLRDNDNRQGQLVLGNATGSGRAMSIDARLALEAGVDSKKVRSMAFSANTEALNVGIDAPQGLRLARGEGFSMGLAPGGNTAIRGAGEFRFELNNGEPNFSVRSRDGIKARVQLGLATTIDRKDRVGNDVRVSVKDGTELEATVREYDLRSGKADLGVRVNAGINSAQVVAEQLQAQVENATGVLEARITQKPGDRSPEIVGKLRVDVAADSSADSSKTPTIQVALPSDVAGYRRAGEGSILTQLLDGRASAEVPIHVKPDGSFVSDNGTDREARFSVDKVKFVSKLDDPRAAGKLPDVMTHQALVDARVMHDQMLAANPDMPLPELTAPAAVGDTTLQDLNRDVVKKIDVSKLLGTAVDNVNVDVKLTIPEDHTIPVADRGFGLIHADAVFKKGGTIRLAVQGQNGELDTQAATLPDGTPNPEATRNGKPTPSGLSFSPGAMRIVVNNDSGILGGSMNVDGVDIVRDPANAKAVKLVPRISNATGIPGWYLDKYGESIAASALQTATGQITVPRTQRELIAMATGAANLHVDLESDVVKNTLESTPAEHRSFVQGLMNSSELRAAITPRATDGRGQPVSIDFGIGKIRSAANTPIVFSRVAGKVEVRGSAEIRDSGFDTPSLKMSFGNARADFRFAQDQNATGDAGAAVVELRGLQASGFNFASQQNSLRAQVTNANLVSADLTLRLGAQPSVTGRLNGMRLDTASFTNTDGSVFDLSRAGVRNVTLGEGGAVKVDGIEGTVSANTRLDRSQIYLERATVRDGAFELTANSEVIARLPQLTNVRGAVTDLNVPREGQGPGGLSANIKRVNFEGDALDISVSPQDGVSLLTTPGRAVRVWGGLSGNAGFPSPRLDLSMTDASFVGSLNALQFAPNQSKQVIDVSDAYVTSDKVRGRAVFGPDGSALADTQLRDATVELAVKRLNLGTGAFTPTVASNVIGRVSGLFALPETVDGKPAVAHGQASGSIEFGLVNDNDIIRARAEAIFSQGRFGSLIRANPDEAAAMRENGAAFYRRHVGVLPPENPFRLPAYNATQVPPRTPSPKRVPVPTRRPTEDAK